MRKPDDPFRGLLDGLLFAGLTSFLLVLVIVIGELLARLL